MFGTVIWIAVGLAGGYLIFKTGFGMLKQLSQPVAPPPPPGEMRKVDIRYRCIVCGTEVRMTLATEELPEAPRHCLEDMTLVAPVE
jgi:hypothetical protein